MKETYEGEGIARRDNRDDTVLSYVVEIEWDQQRKEVISINISIDGTDQALRAVHGVAGSLILNPNESHHRIIQGQFNAKTKKLAPSNLGSAIQGF